MRTAKEIIESEMDNAEPFEEIGLIYERAVNTAMKEAIEECAEIFFNPNNHNSIELAKQLKSLINKLQ